MTPKESCRRKIEGKGGKSRLRKKWMKGVEKELQELGIFKWNKYCREERLERASQESTRSLNTSPFELTLLRVTKA